MKTIPNVHQTFKEDLKKFCLIVDKSDNYIAKLFGQNRQHFIGIKSGDTSPAAKTIDKMTKVMRKFYIKK
jgi:hypothetical protein